MEKNVYEAMKDIKAACKEHRAANEGKCPKDPSSCPLYLGKCFFAGNKPHKWSIKSRLKGETEWYEEV